MPQYGENLENLFRHQRDLFTKQSIYSLAIKIIDMLEQIHAAGFIYNDLKLDNLLLTHRNKETNLKADSADFFKNNEISMIDFGFATRYLDSETGLHCEKELLNIFRGNIVFASTNQLKFYSTSRRDDLISLFYLMVYMLHGGNMPGGINARMTNQARCSMNNESTKKNYNYVLDTKLAMKTSDLCFGASEDLAKFKRLIFRMRYNEEPDYNRCKKIL